MAKILQQQQSRKAERECLICGVFFTPIRDTQVHCPKCGRHPDHAQRQYEEAFRRIDIFYGRDLDQKLAQKAFSREPQECQCRQCSKTFWANHKQPTDFCSSRCKRQFALEHARCSNCNCLLINTGVDLTKWQPHLKYYCSEKCREQAKWRKAREENRVAVCPRCHREFIRSRKKSHEGYVTQWQIFCSNECARAYDPKYKTRFEP